MVSKSKALLIFMAVAVLLTAWLAWAIVSAPNQTVSEARKPKTSLAVNSGPMAEEAQAQNPAPPAANTLEVAVDYQALRGQEPAPDKAPSKEPEATMGRPEDKGSASEASAAQNAPAGSAMGRLGAMLAESGFKEIEPPRPITVIPRTVGPVPEAPPKNAAAGKPAPAPKPAETAATAAKPAPGKASQPARPGQASAKVFSVQLAAFSSAENAGKLKGELEKAGEKAFITQAKVEGQIWHRVMSGRFNTRPEAEAHEAALVKKKLIKAGVKNRVKNIAPEG